MGKLLQKGTKGDEVEALQRDLNLLGFTIETDGIFGKNTLSAIEQLQLAFGYDVDGKVGDGTRGLIEKQKGYCWKITGDGGIKQALEAQGKTTDKGSLAGSALPRTLSEGADGGDVGYVQRKLRVLGFDVKLTGEYDAGTKGAVKELQQAWGYDADGIIGPATNKLIDAQIGYGWKKGQPTSKG